MKSTRTPLMFLAFLALAVGLPSTAPAAGEDGFRGIPWGANLSAHPDMSRVSCEGGSCSYVRSGEDLSMGEAVVSSITYRTVGGRLVEVSIEAPAETCEGQDPGLESGNFLAFRRACQDRFGSTSFAASFEYLRAEHYRWERTGIRKVLKVNFNRNHMLLSITNHDLLEQIAAAGETTASPGAEGFGGRTALRDQAPDEEPAAPVSDSGGEAAGPGRPAEGKSSPLLGKVGGFLRWIFISDEPSAAPGTDLPGANTP